MCIINVIHKRCSYMMNIIALTLVYNIIALSLMYISLLNQ